MAARMKCSTICVCSTLQCQGPTDMHNLMMNYMWQDINLGTEKPKMTTWMPKLTEGNKYVLEISQVLVGCSLKLYECTNKVLVIIVTLCKKVSGKLIFVAHCIHSGIKLIRQIMQHGKTRTSNCISHVIMLVSH